jgi:hypothetical protein
MTVEADRIFELRRYALRPGARETLIELFDREFVETQEDVGMRVLGQFRDLDDPDSFVWFRGFSDMQTRERALTDFYSGPVWKQHAGAANATMIDVDNVLLLSPLRGLAPEAGNRRATGSTRSQPGLLVVTIYPLAERTAGDFPAFFAARSRAAARRRGYPCARDVSDRAQREHLSGAACARRCRGVRLDDARRRRRGVPAPCD